MSAAGERIGPGDTHGDESEECDNEEENSNLADYYYSDDDCGDDDCGDDDCSDHPLSKKPRLELSRNSDVAASSHHRSTESDSNGEEKVQEIDLTQTSSNGKRISKVEARRRTAYNMYTEDRWTIEEIADAVGRKPKTVEGWLKEKDKISNSGVKTNAKISAGKKSSNGKSTRDNNSSSSSNIISCSSGSSNCNTSGVINSPPTEVVRNKVIVSAGAAPAQGRDVIDLTGDGSQESSAMEAAASYMEAARQQATEHREPLSYSSDSDESPGLEVVESDDTFDEQQQLQQPQQQQQEQQRRVNKKPTRVGDATPLRMVDNSDAPRSSAQPTQIQATTLSLQTPSIKDNSLENRRSSKAVRASSPSAASAVSSSSTSSSSAPEVHCDTRSAAATTPFSPCCSSDCEYFFFACKDSDLWELNDNNNDKYLNLPAYFEQSGEFAGTELIKHNRFAELCVQALLYCTARASDYASFKILMDQVTERLNEYEKQQVKYFEPLPEPLSLDLLILRSHLQQTRFDVVVDVRNVGVRLKVDQETWEKYGVTSDGSTTTTTAATDDEGDEEQEIIASTAATGDFVKPTAAEATQEMIDLDEIPDDCSVQLLDSPEAISDSMSSNSNDSDDDNSTGVFPNQGIVAGILCSKIVNALGGNSALVKFNRVEFRIGSPYFLTLEQQTFGRLRKAGLYSPAELDAIEVVVGDNNDPRKIKIHRYTDAVTKKDDIHEQYERNPQTLYVLIADECHFGCALKKGNKRADPGDNHLFVNDHRVLEAKNVVVLLVSATPYPQLTSKSRVKKEHVVDWGECTIMHHSLPAVNGITTAAVLEHAMPVIIRSYRERDVLILPSSTSSSDGGRRVATAVSVTADVQSALIQPHYTWYLFSKQAEEEDDQSVGSRRVMLCAHHGEKMHSLKWNTDTVEGTPLCFHELALDDFSSVDDYMWFDLHLTRTYGIVVLSPVISPKEDDTTALQTRSMDHSHSFFYLKVNDLGELTLAHLRASIGQEVQAVPLSGLLHLEGACHKPNDLEYKSLAYYLNSIRSKDPTLRLVRKDLQLEDVKNLLVKKCSLSVKKPVRKNKSGEQDGSRMKSNLPLDLDVKNSLAKLVGSKDRKSNLPLDLTHCAEYAFMITALSCEMPDNDNELLMNPNIEEYYRRVSSIVSVKFDKVIAKVSETSVRLDPSVKKALISVLREYPAALAEVLQKAFIEKNQHIEAVFGSLDRLITAAATDADMFEMLRDFALSIIQMLRFPLATKATDKLSSLDLSKLKLSKADLQSPTELIIKSLLKREMSIVRTTDMSIGTAMWIAVRAAREVAGWEGKFHLVCDFSTSYTLKSMFPTTTTIASTPRTRSATATTASDAAIAAATATQSSGKRRACQVWHRKIQETQSALAGDHHECRECLLLKHSPVCTMPTFDPVDKLNSFCISCNHVHFPVTEYTMLNNVPLLLILVDKGRMGDTFPRSMKFMDLRTRYTAENASGNQLSSTVQDLGRVCRYARPDEQLPTILLGKGLYEKFERNLASNKLSLERTLTSVDSSMIKSNAVDNNTTFSLMWKEFKPKKIENYDADNDRVHDLRFLLQAPPQSGKTGTFISLLLKLRGLIERTPLPPVCVECDPYEPPLYPVVTLPVNIIDWYFPKEDDVKQMIFSEDVTAGKYDKFNNGQPFSASSQKYLEQLLATEWNIDDNSSGSGGVLEPEDAAPAAVSPDMNLSYCAVPFKQRPLRLAHQSSATSDHQWCKLRCAVNASVAGVEVDVEYEAMWPAAYDAYFSIQSINSQQQRLQLSNHANTLATATAATVDQLSIRSWIFVPSVRPARGLHDWSAAVSSNSINYIKVIVCRQAQKQQFQQRWDGNSMLLCLPEKIPAPALPLNFVSNSSSSSDVSSNSNSYNSSKEFSVNCGVGYARLFVQYLAADLNLDTVFFVDDNLRYLTRLVNELAPAGDVMNKVRAPFDVVLCHLERQLLGDHDGVEYAEKRSIDVIDTGSNSSSSSSGSSSSNGCSNSSANAGDPSKYAMLGTHRRSQFNRIYNPFKRVYVYSCVLVNMKACREKGIWFRPYRFWEDMQFALDCERAGLYVLKYQCFSQVKLTMPNGACVAIEQQQQQQQQEKDESSEWNPWSEMPHTQQRHESRQLTAVERQKLQDAFEEHHVARISDVFEIQGDEADQDFVKAYSSSSSNSDDPPVERKIAFCLYPTEDLYECLIRGTSFKPKEVSELWCKQKLGPKPAKQKSRLSEDSILSQWGFEYEKGWRLMWRSIKQFPDLMIVRINVINTCENNSSYFGSTRSNNAAVTVAAANISSSV